MLTARVEAYREKTPKTYSNFSFDTDINTGTTYYINEIKNEILHINGTINAIKRDITNIVTEYARADKFSNLLENTKDEFDYTCRCLSDDMEVIVKAAGEYLEALYAEGKISIENLTELNESLRYVKEEEKSVAATAATIGLGLLEGFGQFGEDLWDAGAVAGTILCTPITGALDGIQAIAHSNDGKEWYSITKSMWDDTKAYIAQDDCKWMWDSAYDNELSEIRDKTYGFETTRSISNGIGYAAPSIAIGIASGGGTAAISEAGSVLSTLSNGAKTAATVAGVVGFGHGTEDAAAAGASTGAVLAYGSLYGGWNALQYYLGAKISGIDVGNNALNTAFRVYLDTVDSGAEGIVNPALQLIYKDGYVDKDGVYREFTANQNILDRYGMVFEENGGIKNVLQQAAIGGTLSLGGELFEGAVRTATGGPKVRDIPDNTELLIPGDTMGRVTYDNPNAPRTYIPSNEPIKVTYGDLKNFLENDYIPNYTGNGGITSYDFFAKNGISPAEAAYACLNLCQMDGVNPRNKLAAMYFISDYYTDLSPTGVMLDNYAHSDAFKNDLVAAFGSNAGSRVLKAFEDQGIAGNYRFVDEYVMGLLNNNPKCGGYNSTYNGNVVRLLTDQEIGASSELGRELKTVDEIVDRRIKDNMIHEGVHDMADDRVMVPGGNARYLKRDYGFISDNNREFLSNYNITEDEMRAVNEAMTEYITQHNPSHMVARGYKNTNGYIYGVDTIKSFVDDYHLFDYDKLVEGYINHDMSYMIKQLETGNDLIKPFTKDEITELFQHLEKATINHDSKEVTEIWVMFNSHEIIEVLDN